MLPQEIFWILTPQSPSNFLHFGVIQTGYLLTLETIFHVSTGKSLFFNQNYFHYEKSDRFL